MARHEGAIGTDSVGTIDEIQWDITCLEQGCFRFYSSKNVYATLVKQGAVAKRTHKKE